ncbi:T9SS type A sorting domain-containing protein [Algibacter mikhailovii]|uniref:T9SS type A sorting domain-containing protein n=1 Tax=Algibacter mikhailovii TaxID=425498 RepID=UPI0024952D10|nr:T9SS type A sorting domain-containing protein [Algibacter mikhailovii]
MKKITFFILISSVLGFSQSLPFTFDESTDPKYYFKECFDCDFQLTTDPDDAGNKVGQLTSYDFAEFGNAQTIELAQYVDLSDDNNNTITFRIKPVNGTGSGNHMVKFSGGSTPFGAEVKFTTTGTDWQNITLNFGPGLSNYRNLIFFPDFFEKATDVYLIDDIAGGINIHPRARPMQDAPIPTLPANMVKSVYGETYTNLAYLYNFTESFREVDIENKGNKALEVDLGYYGAAFQNTDVSNDAYVHFDYWTTDATKFALRVNSENPGQFEAQYVLGDGGSKPIVKDAWTSVFIPLDYYDNLNVNLKDVFQYNFVDDGGTGTVFIDNIYFTSESNLSVNGFDLTGLSVSPNPSSSSWNINTQNQILSMVEVFDVLGKSVMSLSSKSTSVKIDAEHLQAGIYIARLSTQEGNMHTVKLVKN